MKLFNFKKETIRTTTDTTTDTTRNIDIAVSKWVFAILLASILMGLRLFGVCNISWWVITMPIWIGWALKIIGIVLIGVFFAIFITFASKEKIKSFLNTLQKLKERLNNIELEDSSTTHDE